MSPFFHFVVCLCAFTVSIHSETITINPGDDIQSAIDKVHSSSGQGTVILNKGTYTITKSIYVYSYVTLQGNLDSPFQDIILAVDPNDLTFNSHVIDNPNGNLTHIVLQNFQIIGNIQPSEQNYPPYCLDCSKNCTKENASDPGCSCLTECPHSMRTNQVGVGISSGGTTIDTASNDNLLIKDVQVSHFAMGMTFSGWKDLTISNCHYFNNGMIQEYFHNIYLRRNFAITISGMTSHDSPTGNGINISQSSYITVFLSIFENNYWRGLRIEGEENYIVHNINVYNNTCNGDGDYGFRFANIVNGTVRYNVANNNKPTNVYESNLKNVTFIGNSWQ